VTDYLDIPFESDPSALSQLAFDYLISNIPNWAPAEANLDVMMIRAVSQVAAEVQDLAATVPTTIFRYAGANLFNVPPIEAVSATGLTTWTMRDTAGYTVPAGTLVGISISGSDLVAFQTLQDVVVPPGSLATPSSSVVVSAVEPGSNGSGLSGAVTLISSIGFIDNITLDNPTIGGVDAESDEDYLNRLRLQLTLLAPRPIVPSDFAAMALDVPGVHRALALDGFDPIQGTSDNERMVAIAAVDELGAAVSQNVKDEIAALLEDRREVNFAVNMMDPTYTTVDVTFQVQAEIGFTDSTDLQSRVIQAIDDFLNPETWGLPDSGDQIVWNNEDTVRYLNMAEVIKSVQGVRFIESLTLGLGGQPQAAQDLPLPGSAPMPVPGNIAGGVDLS
jgi:hypothetical protein